MSDPECEVQGPPEAIPRHNDCRCPNPGRGECHCEDDGGSVFGYAERDDHTRGGSPRVVRGRP